MSAVEELRSKTIQDMVRLVRFRLLVASGVEYLAPQRDQLQGSVDVRQAILAGLDKKQV